VSWHKPESAQVAVRLLIVTALLGGTTAYLRAAMRPEHVPPRSPLAEVPMQLGEWTGTAVADFDNEVLEVLGVDDYITRVYNASAVSAAPAAPFQIGLYVGYYRSQRQGDTIHSPMNCLPGAGWQPVDVSTSAIDLNGSPAEVNRVVIQKGELRQLVLYWYQGRGRVVASEYVSRAYLVWDAATRNRSDGALVRVVSPVLPTERDSGAAERRAVEFARLLSPHLSRYLPR
jgi:EpsI family protein